MNFASRQVAFVAVFFGRASVAGVDAAIASWPRMRNRSTVFRIETIAMAGIALCPSLPYR